jgi:hypothetical protein
MQNGISSSTKNFEKTIAFVFIAPQHIVNIMFGQITQFAILFMLAALYLLQSKDRKDIKYYFVVGLLIGSASTVKPFFLVFIPFLVPISIVGKFRISIPLQHFAGVAIGFIVTMVPNIVYFIIFPNAVGEFIQINLMQNLTGQHSTSLTNLIIAFVNIADRLVIQIGVILVIGGIVFFSSYLRFLRSPPTEKQYLHHFTDMTFLILLVYPDSWFLFLAVWYAFMAPSMLDLYNSPSIPEKEMRRLDILWSGSNNLLAFFFFGILLHYLLLGFDPIVPIWLLILYILFQQLRRSIKEGKNVEESLPSTL